MAVSLSVNGKSYSVDVPPQVPLLWVLRDVVGLTGTKFGCGMALCGPQRIGQSSPAEGLDRRQRTPMRLLSERPDHAGGLVAREKSQAE